MASTSETGHAKNVANFQDLIEFVTGYGTTYNPSKSSLKLSNLITLKASAEGNLTDVISKNTNYNNTVNERITAFSGLKAYSTRLVNALQTTDATNETIADAKTFNRKLQGKKRLLRKHQPTQTHQHQIQFQQVNNLTTNLYNILQG